MPNIEEFLTTLRGGKAKHIPLAELGVHPKIKEKLINRPIIELKDDVGFWYQAGYDYIKLQPVCDFNPLKIGLDKNLTFKEDGTLSFKWASESKGVITSFEDLEKYKFPSKNDFDYSRFEEVKKLLPEGMGVIGQYGDIFTMTWEMMGFESFSIALFENPDLIQTLNNTLGELVISMFEYFVQSDTVDAIWYSDDIAFQQGLLISPAFLEVYFFPWLQKIGEIAKKSNKPFIYHTDGILYDVFDRIIECGVDAIHPIEPKAMNIVNVKEKYGSELCLIGNIDVDLLARGSREDIRKTVLFNIENVGANGGYCVGSGNSIPDYINFENYLFMLNTTKDYNALL